MARQPGQQLHRSGVVTLSRVLPDLVVHAPLLRGPVLRRTPDAETLAQSAHHRIKATQVADLQDLFVLHEDVLRD